MVAGMIWPGKGPDNWRLGGKPAQESFLRKWLLPISQFEPVTMCVSKRSNMKMLEICYLNKFVSIEMSN